MIQLRSVTKKYKNNYALKNINLCFMGTIDSFCNMILSEHPTVAGIPSDSSIISDEEAKAVYRQIYVKICSDEYDEKLAGLAQMFNSVHSEPESSFRSGCKP